VSFCAVAAKQIIMKVKLLKKLRRRGQDQVNVYSITTTGGTTTGMSYGHPGGKYRNLFCFGDTEQDVKKKAERIYIEDYLQAEKAKANAR
jgi:hypothetical protein